MDDLIGLVGADNVKFAIFAMAALVFGVAKAWASMLVRRADQQWQDDDGDDGDDEKTVERLTEKVRSGSTLMSMLPRGVVERQVRKSKESGPPPRPGEPPPN